MLLCTGRVSCEAVCMLEIKLDEALEQANDLEKSGTSLDSDTWSSFVKKAFACSWSYEQGINLF